MIGSNFISEIYRNKVWIRVRNHEKNRARFHDSCTIKKLRTKSCATKIVHDFFGQKWILTYFFLIKMPIFVDESEEKGSKRRIDVELVNKGKNYDPFYPIFQQLSRTIFARFKFLARFFSCTKNILATHEIVHESTIRYFSWFRTLV